MAESLAVLVQFDFTGDVVRAERLPVTIRHTNWSEYALAVQPSWFCVIAQIPGAPEWRALNANVESVELMGRRLLWANRAAGNLARWPLCCRMPYDTGDPTLLEGFKK